jgi:signal transduction histidine kinase
MNLTTYRVIGNTFLRNILLPSSILLLFLIQDAKGQNNFVIDHYTNENGLNSNSIKGIEYDTSTGFLWVGTESGLLKFDGHHFTKINTLDKLNLSPRIYRLEKNVKDQIYFYFEDGYFFIRNDSIVKKYPKLEVDYHVLETDKSINEVLAAIQTAHLLGFEIDHVVPDSLNSNDFFFVFHDEAYFFWKRKLIRIPSPAKLMGVIRFHTDIIFYTSDLQFYQFNKTEKKLEAIETNLPAQLSHKISTPIIWQRGLPNPFLSDGDKLWEIDFDKHIEFKLFCEGFHRSNDIINHITISPDGHTYFIGTSNNGLYILKKNQFKNLVASPAQNEPAGNIVYAQDEIPQNTLVLPSGKAISITDPSKKVRSVVGKFLNIYKDAENNTWYNRWDTVYKMNERGTVTEFFTGEKRSQFFFIELKQEMYVLTETTIGLITNTGYKHIMTLPGKTIFNASAVIDWGHNTIAIAGDFILLYHTLTRQLDTLKLPDKDCKIRCFYNCNGIMFIGTYGQGFYGYRDGIIKKMPLDKEQYLLFTHCFMKDNKGFCWISTNRGLFKVSVSALTAAYNNDLNEIYYHYIGKEDGISVTELNGGCQPCGIQLSTGNFSYPSMNGYLVFDPDKLNITPPPGKVFFDEITADTMSVGLKDSTLSFIPAGTRNLQFKVSIPSWQGLENIYAAYQVKGDKTWQSFDIASNNIISLGGLAPGKYQFTIRVRSGFEPMDFYTTTIHFTIPKPWYLKWWFILIAIGMLLLLIWLLIEWRTRNLERKRVELQKLVFEKTEDIQVKNETLQEQLQKLNIQQQKLEASHSIQSRLISIVSHDMITPLKFIGIIAQKLKDRTQDESAGEIQSIVTTSKELELLSINILNWIRYNYEGTQSQPEKFDLLELTDSITEIAKLLAAEKGLKIITRVPAGQFVIQHKETLGVILYNIIMNAIKYTVKGEIEIFAEIRTGRFSFSVKDTGIGMPEEIIEALNTNDFISTGFEPGSKPKFGYTIIRDLLQQVNGSLYVEKNEKAGTTICVSFPILSQAL